MNNQGMGVQLYVEISNLMFELDDVKAENEKLKALLNVPPHVCSKCGMFLGLLHESECSNCELLSTLVETCAQIAEDQCCEPGSVWDFTCRFIARAIRRHQA